MCMHVQLSKTEKDNKTACSLEDVFNAASELTVLTK